MSPTSAILRFGRSELRMVFTRRRNLALLAILALVPVLIAVAVKSGVGPTGGGGIFGSITENGIFAALAAFVVSVPLFLPLVVAVVAGDTVAGEASTGTLRYLLVVPVGRTRMLAAKFGAIVVWCVTGAVLVAVVGALAGLVLFPTGPVTLLSGRDVPYSDALGRLTLVTLYVAACAVTVGALGLFVSTLTEAPLAAMAATLTATIVMEVADAVPQLSGVHRWLPNHYWLQWVDLLRDPVRLDDITSGLWVTLAWVAVLVSLAWARFGAKDITS